MESKKARQLAVSRSRRESSESGDREMDEARRANKRERVSQSKCASTRFIKSLKHETLEKLR